MAPLGKARVFLDLCPCVMPLACTDGQIRKKPCDSGWCVTCKEALEDFSVCHTVSPLRKPVRKVFPGPKSSFVVNLLCSGNPLNKWAFSSLLWPLGRSGPYLWLALNSLKGLCNRQPNLILLFSVYLPTPNFPLF